MSNKHTTTISINCTTLSYKCRAHHILFAANIIEIFHGVLQRISRDIQLLSKQ